MPNSSKRESEPRPAAGRGLLQEDHTEIRLVSAEDRAWWSRLGEQARLRFAERRGKKWTDDETRAVITADPERDDYYTLAESLGRGPGAIRIRRSMMIHLLRDDYDYHAKALAYLEDPKTNHRWADIGQVYRKLQELGYFDKPVHEQLARAQHLQQPHGSWRGDNSSAVIRERRQRVDAVKDRLRDLRGPGS